MYNYEKTGVLSTTDLKTPSKKQLEKGVAIIECIQRIPCNPCVDSCPMHAISMKDINALPVIDFDKCIGCGKCVGVCPGLAIFVVKIKNDKALITLPYEFLPVPRVGDVVDALDRKGNVKETALVKKVLKKGKTMVITIEVNEKFAMDIRNIRVDA
ncbi:4Fe-4S protein [Thermoplasmatales archaeon SCGC AB-539-N05]|nr:4Fe-4S protein [Thermoplasmatales archaeon SCGC AB-539-N05]ENO11800.1 4Fe-4S protein [Thermoplasmatales archaeon SCGC AB-539-C06]